ncbi:MAG: hypothetical protein GX882_04600 [Methanomicrobiales archaeon]|nr:hypothetical protein [Methanomicrobiales archaeon]
MTPGDGVLACTAAGGLTVCVEAETYRITPGDVTSLIFSGRPAPLVRSQVPEPWVGRPRRPARGSPRPQAYSALSRYSPP